KSISGGSPSFAGTSSATSARPSACRLVGVAAAKQIVQPTDAEPTVAIGLDHEPMLAVLVSAAVLFAQEIDEELALLGMFFLEPDGKRHLAWLSIEIVHKQHPIVAPVISHHEHRWVAAGDYREVAPAHLGDF